MNSARVRPGKPLQTREAKDLIIITKDETTVTEETPKSGITLVIKEARELTTTIRKEIQNLTETLPGAARKTMGAVDTETGDDRETTEAVRPLEAAIPQTVDPYDTRKAMKAIGEAAKALEAAIGTKNLIDITQDTG